MEKKMNMWEEEGLGIVVRLNKSQNQLETKTKGNQKGPEYLKMKGAVPSVHRHTHIKTHECTDTSVDCSGQKTCSVV